MNLAVLTSSATDASVGGNGGKLAASSFKDFRVLAKLQRPLVAVRLTRLSRGVEKSIKRGDPERFQRARWLEEAVVAIAQTRPKHAASQELQLCLVRLLRQSFHSLDWRRPLFRGLKLVPAKAQTFRKRIRV